MRLTFRTRSALFCAFSTMCSSESLMRPSDREGEYPKSIQEHVLTANLCCYCTISL